MSEQGKMFPFFITAYTPDGFYSLAKETLSSGIDHLWVLQGQSGWTKTVVMRHVSEGLRKQGCDVELWHSPMHRTHLEGVVAPALRTAVVDGPACRIDRAWGQGIEVDLDTCLDADGLDVRRAEIESIREEIKGHLARSAGLVKQAREQHEQVEAHYVRGMNLDKANDKADALVSAILGGDNGGAGARPTVRSFFTAAWMPDVEAMVDLRPESTDACHTRYIIKGRPGTGKSTLARKIAAAAHERGYDTDLYLCTFAPGSLDGLVIPALSTALLDGTPIHALDPMRPGDIIEDMLECVNLDRVDMEAVRVLQSRQSELRAEGDGYMVVAGEASRRLESIYAELEHDGAVDQVAWDLAGRISAA